MGIVKQRDSRTGVIYVYENNSYWDKEKRQARSHRKLLGRLDEETGLVVPTGKRGRKKKENPAPETEQNVEHLTAEMEAKYLTMLKEKDIELHRQQMEIQKLKKERENILNKLESMVASLRIH